MLDLDSTRKVCIIMIFNYWKPYHRLKSLRHIWSQGPRQFGAFGIWRRFGCDTSNYIGDVSNCMHVHHMYNVIISDQRHRLKRTRCAAFFVLSAVALIILIICLAISAYLLHKDLSATATPVIDVTRYVIGI